MLQCRFVWAFCMIEELFQCLKDCDVAKFSYKRDSDGRQGVIRLLAYAAGKKNTSLEEALNRYETGKRNENVAFKLN